MKDSAEYNEEDLASHSSCLLKVTVYIKGSFSQILQGRGLENASDFT
jgi:hypothetical protein